MKDKKIPESLIVPLMAKFNIEREEAVKRLELLMQSGIMKQGDPREPETHQLIDGFLAQNSEVLAATVLFEQAFTKCIENKEFVSNYDRLAKRNLTEVIRQMKAGHVPKNADKEFKRFEKFVRNTVVSRLDPALA